MKQIGFFGQLALTSVICMVISVIAQNQFFTSDHLPFLFISIACFIVMSIFVHRKAQAASADTNPYVFTRLTMMNSLMKLFLVTGLVVAYRLKFPEREHHFIWPFIASYILFTIFETRYLSILAKK